MHTRLVAAGLRDTADKLEAGVRLQLEDGIKLFECPDLIAGGWLANRERERRHGQQAFFNHNIRLEATNVCVASCLFCAFARLQPGADGAYTMTLEEASQAKLKGICEKLELSPTDHLAYLDARSIQA